jgi:heme/copper-type cytochrome/quinol oxidase subunit 2
MARPACAVAAVTAAVTASAGATNWWLPSNYSEHGQSLDSLFNFIFWMTTIVMIGVFAAMIYFMLKYRHRDGQRKAHFSHGNPKLEMVWTILPAIILIFVSLWSKRVWDEYRYGKPGDDRKPVNILVIGEQFAWNVIYAGPDGKLGRYLVYPKPTDRLWPKGPDGQPFTFTYNAFEDTKGPADMPYADAVKAIEGYISTTNRMGKVFDDPNGKDDVFVDYAPIFVPLDRPVHVQLSSKDVVHDLNLPNFRVRLDAVPGLRGTLTFVPNRATSRDREDDPANRQTFKNLDDLEKFVKMPDHPENQNLLIRIDEKSGPAAKDGKGGAVFDKAPASRDWRYNGTPGGRWLYKDGAGKQVVGDRDVLTVDRVKALKQLGVTEVHTSRAGTFEVVCGELCGGGHYTMRGQLIVVPGKEFAERYETAPEAEAKAPGIERVADVRK